MIHWKQKLLEEGKTFETSEKGNSMSPLIKSGQKHILSPINIKDANIGDIVFCKCKNSYYTHLVKAKNDEKGCLIGNNKGNINGWTKQIYGKVIEIL
jgi:hypothetical protein